MRDALHIPGLNILISEDKGKLRKNPGKGLANCLSAMASGTCLSLDASGLLISPLAEKYSFGCLDLLPYEVSVTPKT